MILRQLFDHQTYTYTYLIADPASGEAALVDPVREQIERDLQLLQELGLTLKYVLETHVHADHVTAAGPLADTTGAKTVGAGAAPCTDIRVGHGDTLQVGAVTIEVLATPGHTDDSLSFKVGDNVLTGDALFVRGTGRTDFQNGDAGQLYDSITNILFALPDETKVWPGHDYRGHTVSTIGEEKRWNPRVAGKSREAFARIMANLNLPPPRFLEEAVPANRACGRAVQG